MNMLRLIVGSCFLFAANWAHAQVPACLATNPPPKSATITYGGKAQPVTTAIEQITPTCIRLNYSGGALWTRASAAGGITCVGDKVQVDYTAANSTFNGMNIKRFMPAACGPAQAVPSTPPAAPSGKVDIYYARSGGVLQDMASAPVTSVTDTCIQISYGGSPLWFPRSAYQYRTEFWGSPAGLDYSARRNTACGVAPTPIPPVASPTSPCPPCACLAATPAPTTALITYGGKIQPQSVRIDQITPSCIRVNYSGSPLWTNKSAAGGVSCVNQSVQIDFTAANSAYNGYRSTTPPPACMK